MTKKGMTLITLGIAVAFLAVVSPAPAGAAPYCVDCDCSHSCDQICKLFVGGYLTCEEFLCEDYPICCNRIDGTAGNDTLNGTSDYDCIYGYGGNDEIHGNGDGDEIKGGSGDDTLYGDAGGDSIFGDSGEDILYGGSGTDYLNGGSGHDLCYQGETYYSCND